MSPSEWSGTMAMRFCGRLESPPEAMRRPTATAGGGWRVVVTVRPGFRTDGASIPRLLWRVFGSPYDPDVLAVLFGLDWTEVSKPIRTWRADKEDDAPDLGLIRRWEEQREANPAAYYDLKVDGKELEGGTRKLAWFISRGIETYPRYAPVLTMQLVVQGPQAAWEAQYRVGTVGDPACPLGWTDPAGRSAGAFLAGVLDPDGGTAYTWLLVKSVLSPRPDGSFTWNLAWQGADAIETGLYGTGGES